jgi:flagellar L-ring protein precursor FlgH
MLAALSRIAVLVACGGLSACADMVPPRVDVVEPTSVRPPPAVAMPAATDGAIYRSGMHRPLFEDRRARFVGDVLTVNILEKTSAKQSSASTLDKSGKVDATVGALPLFKASTLARLGLSGESANTSSGKGDTASDNTFVGTITVTVVEILSNGNLVVSGEKQIGINQNADRLRFSGTVNPATIQADNTVVSTQVADARLQVRGQGDIDRAQTTGWLSRVLLRWSPI